MNDTRCGVQGLVSLASGLQDLASSVLQLDSLTGVWYAIPDLVASVILTGKAPRIRSAFRLVPVGRQPGLRPVQLRGRVPVDPRRDNLFRHTIELRHEARADRKLEPEERERTEQFLKTFANAGSYGVLVEMNRTETRSDRPVDMTVYSRALPSRHRTTTPEDPGRYSFPPVAAVITAAARLMLALLERSVTDRGGSYAFADTDSMAIVANREGGLIRCPGGPHTDPAGHPAVRTLPWEDVDRIVDWFASWNPYDPKRVPGSVPKIEKVNFDKSGDQRELRAYVISAKRYALFTLDPDESPVIRSHSEHGLGTT